MINLCTTCNKHKPFNAFTKNKKAPLGITNQCKECYNREAKISRRLSRIKRKGLPMFFDTIRCKSCGVCKPVGEFIQNNKKSVTTCKECRRTTRRLKYERNKESVKIQGLKYRRDNKEEIKSRSKLYYIDNKDDIRAGQKEYAEATKEDAKRRSEKCGTAHAKYSKFHDLLPASDILGQDKDLLIVACKQCGSGMTPTYYQAQARVFSYNNLGHGECNFYCSEKCKEECDIYYTQSVRKSERPTSAKSRACQTNHLKQLQCDEAGYNYCEKCGDIIDVELHHTQGVNNKDSINSAGHILLCLGCHRDLHLECK